MSSHDGRNGKTLLARIAEELEHIVADDDSLGPTEHVGDSHLGNPDVIKRVGSEFLRIRDDVGHWTLEWRGFPSDPVTDKDHGSGGDHHLKIMIRHTVHLGR